MKTYENEEMQVGQLVVATFGSLSIVGRVTRISHGNYYIEDVRNGDQFKGLFGFNEYEVIPKAFERIYITVAKVNNDAVRYLFTLFDGWDDEHDYMTEKFEASTYGDVSFEIGVDNVVPELEQSIGVHISFDGETFQVTEQTVIYDNPRYRSEGDKPEIRDYGNGEMKVYKTMRGIVNEVERVFQRINLKEETM